MAPRFSPPPDEQQASAPADCCQRDLLAGLYPGFSVSRLVKSLSLYLPYPFSKLWQLFACFLFP